MGTMSSDPNPSWLQRARREIGVKEVPGPRSNQVVVNYFRDAVAAGMADSVPWCMAFVNAMLERSGYRGTRSLAARSALQWGERLAKPIPGAIGVWPRGKAWQGHIGFVDTIERGHVWLISGNQHDAVTRARYPIATALGWRWPLPPATPKAFAQQGVSGMNAQEIMERAKELHGSIDTLSSISAGRKLAKDAIALVFYLAKLQVPSPKALPKSLKLAKPRKTRVTATVARKRRAK